MAPAAWMMIPTNDVASSGNMIELLELILGDACSFQLSKVQHALRPVAILNYIKED